MDPNMYPMTSLKVMVHFARCISNIIAVIGTEDLRETLFLKV